MILGTKAALDEVPEVLILFVESEALQTTDVSYS